MALSLMTGLLRSSLLILAAALLGALGYTIHLGAREGRPPGVPGEVPSLAADFADEPDLRLGGASITEFSPSGQLKFRLHAQKMSRFEATGETLLDAPKLLILSDTGNPWDVVSTRGSIHQQADAGGQPENLVRLRENVVLRQLDAVTTRPLLVIRSEVIDLYPERQFAKSPTDVMIDSDVGRTQAADMQGNLKSGQLLLSSDAQQLVHTIVLPTQFKARN